MDMDIDLVAEDRCGGEGSGAERDSEEKLVFFYLSRKRKSPFNKQRLGSGSGSGFGCSTTPDPEPKERKREWGEEESRRLEERRQKLKSEDKRLESGVLSVEGNCDCWVIPINGGAAERRSLPYRASDFLFRPSFVPNHRYNPNVRYLGTSIDSLPLGSVGCDSDWDSHLVTPDDHMTHIPSSPVLPLFSLIRLSPPEVVVNGVPEIGRDEVFGISFSLPINPPHSHLIPSNDHPLPTFPTTLFDLAIIGSCNGLYCLRSTLHDEEFDYLEPSDELVSVIVWNPTTGLSRQLPTYRHPPYNIDCHDGLVFGFGYDPSTEDYKVVKIDVDTRLVEVFSLYSNSNSWKSVQCLPKCISDIQRHFSNGAVSFEGCLNWPGYSGVASFNLATETFRFLPLPFGINDLICLSLCVLDGYFSFVSLHGVSRDLSASWRRSSRVLDVWIMRKYDDDSSWTNVASIVFPHCIYTPYRILYLSKDVLILAMNGSRPLVFNLKENSLVCPHICGATYHYRGFEPYVQSNVSPNCRGVTDGKENGK